MGVQLNVFTQLKNLSERTTTSDSEVSKQAMPRGGCNVLFFTSTLTQCHTIPRDCNKKERSEE